MREVTKLHEEVFRAPLSELVEHCARGLRGEVTLVVEGSSAGSEPMSWEAVEEEIRVALDRDDLPPGELSARLARLSGLPRREIYARIVELRKISNGRPVSS